MTQTTELPSAETPATVGSVFRYHGRRSLLIGTAALAFALCWWLGKFLHAPEQPHYDPSILLQGRWLITLIAIVAGIAGSAIIGGALTGRLREDTPVFIAAIGLAAFSVRGGTIDTLLRLHGGGGTYFMLAIETLLLGGILLLAYWLQTKMTRIGLVTGDIAAGRRSAEHYAPKIQLLAVAMHVAIVEILVLILAQSTDKLQGLLVVGASSLLASLITFSFFQLNRPILFCLSPIIVGVLAYLLASVMPGRWELGIPAFNTVSPTPLDYAAAGVAGSILGYWFSSKGKTQSQTT